jgi:hypothetical protein
MRLAGLKYGSRGLLPGSQYAPPNPQMNTPSLPQAEGITVHTGMSHYYAGLGIQQNGEVLAADNIYTNVDQILTPHEAMRMQAAQIRERDGITIDLPRLQDCVDAYIAYYKYDGWIVMGVETIVSNVVIDPIRRDADGNPRKYLYTARVDLIMSSGEARESDRRVFFADHKTGQASKTTTLGYSASGQIHGLRWLGSQAIGESFGGVLLNMISRDPPFRFSRPSMDPAPALVTRFPQTIIDAERRIADAESSGALPKDWTPVANETVCVGRYGLCPAWEKKLCQW